MSAKPEVIINDGWRISKEIPLALIISIAGSLFLGGIGYQSLKGDIAILNAAQKDQHDDAKDLKSDVSNLGMKLQGGDVPSALTASRVSSMEAAISELRGRVSENERKLLRIESTQANRSAK